jgi:hypothetical protein
VGECDPTTGKVSRHLGCRVARLQQHHYKGEQLDPNLTPLVREHILFCVRSLAQHAFHLAFTH